ncbi:TrkH family potassium uptake protein [Candidatus Omnitrophota bacterium]
MKKVKLTPPQVIVLSFLSVIIAGSAILSLPMSTADNRGIGIVDSLFTATSATCVTGLATQDTGNVFSIFGKIVILCLIQVGGLGIMTFSTLFAIMLGRRLTISHNLTVQSALGHTKIEGLRELIAYIVFFTFSIEALGAAGLFFRWRATMGWDTLATLKHSIFHAVSAFCNAGFSLFSSSFQEFRSDAVVMGIISALIIIGGLGFVVFLELPKFKFWGKDRRPITSRLNLQTKLVVLITVFLIVVGALGVFVFENNNLLKGMSLHDKAIGSLFTSVTPRTAGFNVLSTADLRPVTLFMLILLMFIGASPGSTGGGIKTVTFGIILAGIYSMLYNRDRIVLFGRTIPKHVYRRAAVIFFLGLFVIIASTFLLSITESALAGNNPYFLNILFESTSAFGTVGLSTGITPQLSGLGKIVIICTMFIGRLGPLTMALAIAMKKNKVDYRYPEEKLMVG